MIAIKLQDLAVSALIYLLDNGRPGRVKMTALSAYGTQVQAILAEQNCPAVLHLSRDETNAALHRYADYFTIDDEDLCCRRNITADDLRPIRLSASLQLLSALVNKQALSTLDKAGA